MAVVHLAIPCRVQTHVPPVFSLDRATTGRAAAERRTESQFIRWENIVTNLTFGTLDDEDQSEAIYWEISLLKRQQPETRTSVAGARE